MTDIAPRVTEYSLADDLSWLGSAHGVSATRSITLDVSKFDPATHYPNGILPSGLAVAKDPVTGKYVPAAAAAGDDPARLDQIVFLVAARQVTAPGASILAAGLDHGRVVEARLPVAVTAAVKTAIGPRIQFV